MFRFFDVGEDFFFFFCVLVKWLNISQNTHVDDQKERERELKNVVYCYHHGRLCWSKNCAGKDIRVMDFGMKCRGYPFALLKEELNMRVQESYWYNKERKSCTPLQHYAGC
ncbi:hypothetical protein DVH24_019900 [Malus domestica]|uniref:Uncharacterized protein n=1 Tax=Malus domestica TaxID=3750 RepID=A0A498I488_MALDO|nr:hypothetical protein DVH24_019900 [Malus domestica]